MYLKPFFNSDGAAYVPYSSSSFSKAPCVQMMNRPRCDPGASCRRLRRDTQTRSSPGMLRKPFVIPASSL